MTMLRFLSLVLSLVAIVAGLTSDQLLLAFPGAKDGELSGSTTKLPRFELTAVRNTSHALFVINATSTAPNDVGWLGIGQGTAMSNADFLLAWPTTSGNSVNWTLSHRLPNFAARQAHATPQLASTSSSSSSTSSFFTLVPALTTSSSDSPYASVAWLRALNPGEGYPAPEGQDVSLTASASQGEERFIYASCSDSPGSADENEATFRQHNQPYGSTSINLSTPISLASTSSTSPSSGSGTAAGDSVVSGTTSNTAQGGRTSRDKAWIAHATMGSIAVVLLTPLAILAARFGRYKNCRWFPSHVALNTSAAVLVVATFAIGVRLDGNEWDDLHKRLGLTLLLLYLLQPLLGLLAHSLTRPTALTSFHPSLRSGFPPFPRALHIIVGIVIVALGYLQVATGLYGEWENGTDEMTEVPKAVKGVFLALVGVEVALYLGAWVYGAVTREKGAKREIAGEEGALVGTSSTSPRARSESGGRPSTTEAPNGAKVVPQTGMREVARRETREGEVACLA